LNSFRERPGYVAADEKYDYVHDFYSDWEEIRSSFII
jgi:hypothetical protein